jgi:glycosyltransferase involved in cell wall biosynthesis
MKLAVIVPAFNEEQTIREVVRRLRALPMDKEIVVVDDASTDGTSRVLEELAGPDLVVIRHGKNRGKGAAIRTALPRITAEAVVIQDADLEYAPEQLPGLLKPIEEGRADAVYGSRFLGSIEGMRLANYLANKMLAWGATLLYGQLITDEATCYKMFRTDLLRSMPLECERYEFCPEVTARTLLKKVHILELPIDYKGRTVLEGKKINLGDAFSAFATLLKYRFRRTA